MGKDILDEFYEMRAQKEEKYQINYRNLLLREQISNLRKYCIENNLNKNEIEELRDVLDYFLYKLYFSLDKVNEWDDSEKINNVMNDTRVWQHANLVESLLEGSRSNEHQAYEKIDINSFCECARIYLQHPCLQSGTLDWFFIDISIFYVLYGRIEAIKNRDLKSIAVNALSKGKAIHTCLYSLVWTCISCGLRYIAPITLILYAGDFFKAHVFGMCFIWVYLIYLAYKLVSIPSFIKVKRNLNKSISEWDKLSNIYQNLSSRLINIRIVLNRIEELKIECPLFDNYVVPLINRALNRGSDTIFVWSLL